jgi:hypothetical protein
MLQLAGALLLRQLAAAKEGTTDQNGVIAATNNGDDHASVSPFAEISNEFQSITMNLAFWVQRRSC